MSPRIMCMCIYIAGAKVSPFSEILPTLTPVLDMYMPIKHIGMHMFHSCSLEVIFSNFNHVEILYIFKYVNQTII